jgi:NADH-ubiquinone oxidoreductase chain 1
LLTGSLNLTVNIEAQRSMIFFIGSVAETNRAPFDLAEAESELVSGFMTEHAAVIFVFFFLAEYGSILLMCILTSILFLGGYLLDYSLLLYVLQVIDYDHSIMNKFEVFSSPLIEGMISGLTLGVKSCIMVFVFI